METLFQKNFKCRWFRGLLQQHLYTAVTGGADDVGIRRADHDILMDSGIVQALGQHHFVYRHNGCRR